MKRYIRSNYRSKTEEKLAILDELRKSGACFLAYLEKDEYGSSNENFGFVKVLSISSYDHKDMIRIQYFDPYLRNLYPQFSKPYSIFLEDIKIVMPITSISESDLMEMKNSELKTLLKSMGPDIL